MHDPKNPNSLANNKVRAIYEDSRGIFWIGTAGNDGLHNWTGEKTFLQDTLQPYKARPTQRPPLNNDFDPITFIQEDGSGAIWIGTNTSGMNRYDTAPGKSHISNPVTVIRIMVVLRLIHHATGYCGWVHTRKPLFYTAWIHP